MLITPDSLPGFFEAMNSMFYFAQLDIDKFNIWTGMGPPLILQYKNKYELKTIQELAKSLNVSVSTIRRWLNGKSMRESNERMIIRRLEEKFIELFPNDWKKPEFRKGIDGALQIKE